MSDTLQIEYGARRDVRHRRSHRKSRGGCQTCKIRRVKCDEATPACNRCISTGRTCDGYVTEQGLLRGIERLTSQAMPRQPSTQCWPRMERQAFEFFRSSTAQALCAASQGEQHTWLNTIPQMAMSEPAVRHALCALASLHWYTVQPSTEFMNESLELSVCQYQKAMFALRTRKDAGISVAIISCLIFTLYESFQGQQEYAMLHVRHGAKLLLSQATPKRSAHPVPPPSLSIMRRSRSIDLCPRIMSIFLRLVCHLKLLGGQPPDIDTFGEANFQCEFAFQSATEASQAFEAGYLAGIESFETRSGRVCVTRVGHYSTMQRWTTWCAAFDAFMGPLNDDFVIRNAQPEILRLLVYRRVCKIALDVSPSTSETVFDNFLADFRHILDLCSRLVDIWQPVVPAGAMGTATMLKTTTVASTPKLTVSSGPLLEILYLVCWKCREPSLRRRALHLLSVFNMRDGLLDSKKLMACAARIIETEEERALNLVRSGGTRTFVEQASDVPAAARLHSSTPLEHFLKSPSGREMLFHNHQHEHLR